MSIGGTHSRSVFASHWWIHFFYLGSLALLWNICISSFFLWFLDRFNSSLLVGVLQRFGSATQELIHLAGLSCNFWLEVKVEHFLPENDFVFVLWVDCLSYTIGLKWEMMFHQLTVMLDKSPVNQQSLPDFRNLFSAFSALLFIYYQIGNEILSQDDVMSCLFDKIWKLIDT